MTTNAREAFLQRVRQAVAQGNQAGGTPPLPERGTVGYQGAGPDPLRRLNDELAAAGGKLYLESTAAAAVARVRQLVRGLAARKALLGDGSYLESLGLEQALTADGVEVTPIERLKADEERPAFFAADVGISGVDAVVAETGTLALATRRNQPRAVSLLPPVHIAVAHRDQLVPDLFDLLSPSRWSGGLPACLSLITGPSKTGDIELKLVTGVHGPGEVHLVLVTG